MASSFHDWRSFETLNGSTLEMPLILTIAAAIRKAATDKAPGKKSLAN